MMRAYVARLNQEAARPGEIVGFFFAEDPEDLPGLIDQCCDVDCCEVLELPSGGIYWAKSTRYVLPLALSETAPGLPAGAIMTEEWLASLCVEGCWAPTEEAIALAQSIHDNDD